MLIKVLLIFLVNGIGLIQLEAKEVENYYDFSTKGKILSVSFEGTSQIKSYLKKNMVPRGASVLTESGSLSKQGIKGILHAASGSMTNSSDLFRPTLKGVELSIINSIKIAKFKKYKKVALPFIGSGIFINSIGISKFKLAQRILSVSANHSDGIQLTIVAYSTQDLKLFNNAKEILNKKEKKISDKILIVQGSITDFSVHKSELIVNAANTELIFGGGLSGHIGKKTEQQTQINNDCKLLIDKLKKK